MAPLAGREWEGGYAFRPFRVEETGVEFTWARRSTGDGGKERKPRGKGSNICAVWTAGGVEEVLIGGVVAGRKKGYERGASEVSRGGMWKVFGGVVEKLGREIGGEGIPWGVGEVGSYEGLKGCEALSRRKQVGKDVKREVLKGWDGGWGERVI